MSSNSPPRDPIISGIITLRPGMWWKDKDGEVAIVEAQVCLLNHGDNVVCNAIPDQDKRRSTRFRWGIHRLGQFIGRERITEEMINRLKEPDIMRLEQAQVDLFQSFRDSPEVECPICGHGFTTEVVKKLREIIEAEIAQGATT
jgi:hypothetical protein